MSEKNTLDLLASDGTKRSALDLLSDRTPPAPPQIQPNLFQELVNRDPYRGGVSWMATGSTGSGKTALMVHIINKLFAYKKHIGRELREGKIDDESRWIYEQIAAEKVFWIGDSDCQWWRVPVRATQGGPEHRTPKLFFVEDGINLKFFLNREPVKIKSNPFTDFGDIISRANSSKLNVVYIRDPLDVMDFIQYMVSNSLGEWNTIAVDEVEDVVPSYLRSDNWSRAQTFARRMSKARKRNISFYATLQSDSQLDWRTPDIVPHRGLCQGAKCPDGWKIFKWVCGDVPRGQAHIATRTHFQKISYPAYTREGTMKCRGLVMWEDIREQTTAATKKMAEKREKAKAEFKKYTLAR